jgi:arylsulfatase A-like enzyme
MPRNKIFKNSITYLMVMAIFMTAVLSGCKNTETELAAQFKDCNILLVSIDTLRADHLGCYGYTKKTPFIDSIASQGFLFESMYTTSSTTLPAHISLMTARYPGNARNGYYLSDSATTLAEILTRNNYVSMAFTSSLPLDRRFNLDQGFSVYDSDFKGCKGSLQTKKNKWNNHTFDTFDRNASETTQQVLNRLKKSIPSRPYFLWVHYFDPHIPYSPPDNFYSSASVTRKSFPYFFKPDPSDLTSLNELYDGEIRFVDDQLKTLVLGLKKMGLFDNTILVIVSDHGENLYEHDNYLDHSRVVYETVMHIPCVIYLPGQQRKRVSSLASIIDIMPTLLNLLDIKSPKVDGRDLTGVMSGKSLFTERAYVTCETNNYGLSEKEQTIAVRTKNTKYIFNLWNNKLNLFYNLQKDPLEKNPDINSTEKNAEELEDFFHSWYKKNKTLKIAEKHALDENARDIFKSLGYIK